MSQDSVQDENASQGTSDDTHLCQKQIATTTEDLMSNKNSEVCDDQPQKQKQAAEEPPENSCTAKNASNKTESKSGAIITAQDTSTSVDKISPAQANNDNHAKSSADTSNENQDHSATSEGTQESHSEKPTMTEHSTPGESNTISSNDSPSDIHHCGDPRRKDSSESGPAANDPSMQNKNSQPPDGSEYNTLGNTNTVHTDIGTNENQNEPAPTVGESQPHSQEPHSQDNSGTNNDFVPDKIIMDGIPVRFHADPYWLDLQFSDKQNLDVKRPDQIEKEMSEPTFNIGDKNVLKRIQGSIIGMALGDALGAHVEFRPHSFLEEHPVKDLEGGGTWGLQKGQFTDDTSMALCLANSLIARGDFVPYDQLVRYKWWYRHGYMSSTGKCFDIGAATSHSLMEFERRQKEFANEHGIPLSDMDYLTDNELMKKFNCFCSEEGVAGNGALMRLAPAPLFFYKSPELAVEYSGISGQITHGDQKAYDACRYYGALIVAALLGYPKSQLLDNQFYSLHKHWFGNKELHPDILAIANGSYKRGKGHADGIRGKGYIVNALEAALWAFWSDKDSFENGALNAVNLGDDTDTTAAIYGQLAGAFYGYDKLPEHWTPHVYAKDYLEKLSKWTLCRGSEWYMKLNRNSDESQKSNL